jgi:hypothetical protein
MANGAWQMRKEEEEEGREEKRREEDATREWVSEKEEEQESRPTSRIQNIPKLLSEQNPGFKTYFHSRHACDSNIRIFTYHTYRTLPCMYVG